MLKQTLVGKVIGTLLKASPPWTPYLGLYHYSQHPYIVLIISPFSPINTKNLNDQTYT